MLKNWLRQFAYKVIMEKFRGQIQIDFRFSEHLGPRFESAGVTLRLSTDDKYKFSTNVKWSEEDYSRAVESGVRDGLKESGYDPDRGIDVILESIEYHPIDSSERSFYVAAKCAVMAKAIISRSRSTI